MSHGVDMIWIPVVIFVFLAGFVSNTNQNTYKAAVVEYAVKLKSIPEYIQGNVDNYCKIIEEYGSQDVDILVFPESTLNNAFTPDRNRILNNSWTLPDPSLKVNPCETKTYSEHLQKISCAARSAKMYIVINLSEKKLCTEEPQLTSCASDGYQLYNTNIVFDRQGNVISRYRKTHLFGEPAFNTTSPFEIETFTTDFNVTFGHLICFDLMFQTPGINMLSNNVKNFITPMMWYSEIPFLTSVQYQEAWAYTHNVNLLVSGANNPRSGCGGSGIYSGRLGARTSFITGDLTSKILMATINRDTADNDENDVTVNADAIESTNAGLMNLLRDNVDEYAWEAIDTSLFNVHQTKNICQRDFCCNVTVKIAGNSDNKQDGFNVTYMAVAYRGLRTYSGVRTGGVETCGVIACNGQDITTCGRKHQQSEIQSTDNNGVTFEEIKIQGKFTKSNATQFPITLSASLLPLRPDNYEFKIQDGDLQSDVQFSLRGKSVDNLMTFAIFGRDYSRDDSKMETNGSVTEKLWIKLSRDLDESFASILDESEAVGNGDFFEYVFSRLQILTFIVAIYFLEML